MEAQSRVKALCALVLLVLPVIGGKQCEECVTDKNMLFDCSMAHCEVFPTDIIGYDVKEVRLQDNYIDHVPALQFPKMTILDLNNNNISSIAKDAFVNCLALKTVYLASNEIAELNEHHFGGVPMQITHLYLNSNKLKRLKTDTFNFPYLPELVQLDLSRNLLSYIENEAFTDLEKLVHLDLSHNNLTVVTDRDFRRLTALDHLDLSDNGIHEIQSTVFFHLENLDTLVLSRNCLTNIADDAFEGLGSLAVLELSHNALRTIDPLIFEPLTKLQSLHLDGNLLVELSEGMLVIPTLYTLSMNNMVHLRAIRNNSLENLPALKKFSASGNFNLTTIELMAFGGDNSTLEILDLSQNFLSTLQKGVAHWRRLQQLRLRKNPWRCDCNLEWMREVYMPNDEEENIVCESPAHLSGRKIKQVPLNHFVCSDQGQEQSVWQANKHRFASGLLVMGGFLVGLITVVTAHHFRHTIMPCFYMKPGRYVSLYNKTDTDDSEVKIEYQDEARTPLKFGDAPMATTV